MKATALLLCTLTAGTAMTSSTQASDRLNKPPAHPQGYVATVAPLGADIDGCVKSCQSDLSPCDPPAFKRTDGRCAGN